MLIPLIIGSFKYKYLSKSQTWLFYLLIATAVTEVISNFLWYQSINNFPVFHVFTIFQFIFIIGIYKIELRSVFSKNLFNIALIIFVAFAIINSIWLQSIYAFNSNTITIVSYVTLFFSLAYFYKLLKEVKYEALEKTPMFWLNIGFLIYFSSNLLLFFLNDYLPKGSPSMYLVWSAHAVVNIILNIFYTIALWIKAAEP